MSESLVQIQMLPVADIIPTPDNTRFFYPEGGLESLAESLKKVGMRQPVVCRPHPTKKGKYDLRAGERRLRAAKLAGIKEIPATVVQMSDQEAMEVTATENFQRENLHPLEEAEAIEKLISTGHTYATIAPKLGKTEKFIARRTQIAKLSDAWKEAIRNPKMRFVEFSAAHLERVSRIPHESQDALLKKIAESYEFKRGGSLPTIHELECDINDGLCVLRLAPFKMDDDTLLPKAGSCTNCQKRSGQHPLLFDEFISDDVGVKQKKDKDERCLDIRCFQAKTVVALTVKGQAIKEEHGKAPLLIRDGYQRDGIEESFDQKVLDPWTVTNAKKSDKGAVPAMYVNGPKVGQLAWVQNGREKGDGSIRGKRSKGEVMSLARRRTALKERRMAHVVRAVKEQLDKLEVADLEELVGAGKISGLKIVALASTFGTNERQNFASDAGKRRWDEYADLLKLKEKRVGAELLYEVVQVFSDRLNFYNNQQVAGPYVDAEYQCELLGIDFKPLVAAAEAEIPEPKGWANLKPDGTPKNAAPAESKKTKPKKKSA